MELDVQKIDGSASGEKVKLPKHVFGVEPHQHSVYLAVKAQLANMRQGTASSKNRTEARGGGRKPWRQKGRGAARAGSTRSPLWVGGGRVFGPRPRDFSMKLPKKVKTLARKSAYSDKVKAGKVTVIEDFKLNAPKTKEMFEILKKLGLTETKTLLLLSSYDQDILRAGRNLPFLQIRMAASESTYDLLNCENLVIQKSAIERISGVFKR